MDAQTSVASVTRKLYRSIRFVSALALLLASLLVTYRESYVRLFGGRHAMIADELEWEDVTPTGANLPDTVPDSHADAFFSGQTRGPRKTESSWTDSEIDAAWDKAKLDERNAEQLIDRRIASDTFVNLLALGLTSANFAFWIWIGWLFKPEKTQTSTDKNPAETLVVNG